VKNSSEVKYRIFSPRRNRVLDAGGEGSLHCYSKFFMDENGEGIEIIYSTKGDVLDINKEQTETVHRRGSFETFLKYIFQRYAEYKTTSEDKIFEGDVVDFKYKENEHGDVFEGTGKVYFDDIILSWCIETEYGGMFGLHEVSVIEIIGNTEEQ